MRKNIIMHYRMRKNQMIKKAGLVPLLLIFLLMTESCISEYTPKGIDELSGLLVVEGIISNDSSDIKLSYSVGIYQHVTQEYGPINYAHLMVQCDDGAYFTDVSSLGDGNYRIYNGKLDSNKKYRLLISIQGMDYESEYLAPLMTPPIDNIALQKADEGADVYVTVSTHDPENQSLYYMWSYEEHWELKAYYYAGARWIDVPGGEIQEHSLATSENTYYCWNNARSRKFLLASSEKLTENAIYNYRLTGYEPSNDRWSILYYIKVKQSQIRRSAYDYYTNLQKNVEQTGSIFSPMPSEMKGNIRCVTDPEEDVIGYVEVSASTILEQFMPTSPEIYESGRSYCPNSVVPIGEVEDLSMYQIYEYSDRDGVSSVTTPDCVDCRARGSKNRPSFWPNTHY